MFGTAAPTAPATGPAATAPVCPPGSTAPCPLACPVTEIQINDTPVATDDLVMLKCLEATHDHSVPCRIRATGSPAAAATVVLTNPDGRVRFGAGAGAATLTLSVPADGSWVSFRISGAAASAALND